MKTGSIKNARGILLNIGVN